MTAMGQGEGQAQTEGQNGDSQGQGQQGPDISGMVDQLGTVASGMEEMRQFLASQPWQQQATEGEQEQDNGELDLSWLDPQSQTYEDPAAVAARLSEQLNGAVDQRAQALIAPIAKQLMEMQHELQARDLAGEFPELASDDVANKIAGQGGLAQQLAGSLDRSQPLEGQPNFWRLVYMAHKAAESANAENGSGDPAARLESGSGPGPANQMTEADIVQGIVNAGDGLGKRVLDFRQ